MGTFREMLTSDVSTMDGMIVELGIATEDEIELVCNICGCSPDTFNNIVYARTGYCTLLDYFDSEVRK